MRALAEPPRLRALFDAIMVPAPLADELGPALADDLPLLARDGGLVRRGFNLALDEIRDLRDEPPADRRCSSAIVRKPMLPR